MKILIVDDEEMNVMMLQDVIESYLESIDKYKDTLIDVAYNGEEALQKALQNEYDLILTDIIMPKMDGFELTRNIRATCLRKQPIIIMVTAIDNKEEMREGFLSGVNWYLTKPLDIEELEILINEVAARKVLPPSQHKKYVIDESKNNKQNETKNKDIITDKDDINNDEVENSEFEDFDSFDDDFFDFDSEEVDSNINVMHSSCSSETVSAKEFMEEGIIDYEDIEDLNENLEEFHLEGVTPDEFNRNIEKLLSSFIRVLNSSYVFENLAYGLGAFLQTQKNISIEDLDENNQKLYKMLIETMVEDLKKWVNDVLIEQTAVDIHYLDASLLASVAQIEILLKQNS